MWKTLAALAALGCAGFSAPPAIAVVAPLQLQQAMDLTLEKHPELRLAPLRRAALAADAGIAAQRPPLVVGASLENALGSGDYRGVDGAELTLTAGSVFEPADRRAARVELAQSRLAGIDLDTEARRLDLLAEVARRYLDALAAQAQAEALAASVRQREATVAAAARRVAAGASPPSVRLGAEAVLIRTQIDLARARESAAAARRRLALLWGEAEPAFARVAGDLLVLPEVPDFALLAAWLERTPELQRFAGEARVREARLQLARTQARPEFEWEVGVRRLQDGGDMALVGSISLPLGSRARAAPAIRGAEAELEALALEREAGTLVLRATLAEAHGRLRVDALAVRRAGDELLPALQRAEGAAGDAYRAGALSQLEWAQLQADTLAARLERIAAARDFHRALIEIQRLTGEPFVLAAAADTEESP